MSSLAERPRRMFAPLPQEGPEPVVLLLRRIAVLTKRAGRADSRVKNLRISREYWRGRAVAAEAAPLRELRREIAAVKRDNERLKSRIVALGGNLR